MLGRGTDSVRRSQVIALQALHHGRGKQGLQGDVFAVGLIGAPPADIPCHGDGRCEGPADAGGREFSRRYLRQPPGEVRVASGADTDVVRQDHRRAIEVGVAVDRIDAEHQRDTGARLQGFSLVAVEHFAPAGGGLQCAVGDSADQRTQDEAAGFLGRDVGHVPLHHLTDLLCKCHGGNQVGDVGFSAGDGRPGGVGCSGHLGEGPLAGREGGLELVASCSVRAGYSRYAGAHQREEGAKVFESDQRHGDSSVAWQPRCGAMEPSDGTRSARASLMGGRQATSARCRSTMCCSFSAKGETFELVMSRFSVARVMAT